MGNPLLILATTVVFQGKYSLTIFPFFIWTFILICFTLKSFGSAVKPVYNGHSQNGHELVFKINYRLKCIILQGEHYTILLIFIKLPFLIKIFVLAIFEWQFYTFTQVLLYFISSQAVNSMHIKCE